MKPFPVAKMIGLVRHMGGVYLPSNQRQRDKLDTILRLEFGTDANAPTYPNGVPESHLTVVRMLAKKYGFKIVTGRMALTEEETNRLRGDFDCARGFSQEVRHGR
jgi:hypothetical protein